jgi:hypothetical protein
VEDLIGAKVNYQASAIYQSLVNQWERMLQDRERRRDVLHKQEVLASEIAQKAQTLVGVLDWLIEAAERAWAGLGTRYYLKPMKGGKRKGFTLEVGLSQEGAWVFQCWSYHSHKNKTVVLGEGWLYWEVGTTDYEKCTTQQQVHSFRTPSDAAKMAYKTLLEQARKLSIEKMEIQLGSGSSKPKKAKESIVKEREIPVAELSYEDLLRG